MSLNVKQRETSLKRSVSTPGTLVFNWRTNIGTNTDLDRIDTRFHHLSVNSSPNGSHNNHHNYNNNNNNIDNSNNYLNLMPTIVRNRSIDFQNSSPINKIRFDFGEYHQKYDDIQDVQRVAPEDLASQMTLIDLSVFAAIQPQELSSGQWNGPKKNHNSPNVVAFTQRFNRVTFWAIQEILSHKSAKHRAEVLSHFLKVAKRLLELNNLHSAFAIKSALSSAPIHRLTKTWAYLSKKDKQLFKQLDDLFADKDNFERLRDHLNSSKAPCIPYLGLYLHDIVYVDVAHPLVRGHHESHQRSRKMDAILRVIAEFQRSVYDNLTIMPNVQKYLLSVRYIEELQKFVEEDNFNLSLSLEPPETDGKSVFYVREHSQTVRSNNDSGDQTVTSSQTNRLSVSFNCADTQQPTANSMPAMNRRRPFAVGHRKSQSLGTNVLTSIMASTTIPLTSKTFTVNKTIVENKRNLCLIDDTIIAEEATVQSPREPLEPTVTPSLPTIEIIYDESTADDETRDEREPDDRALKTRPSIDSTLERKRHLLSADKIVFQGMVKRRTSVKDGKRPQMKVWAKYWLLLQGTQLLYFDCRQFRTYKSNVFKSKPLKCQSLEGWFVALVENNQSNDTFTLSDTLGRNVYKFRAPTPTQAFEWYKKISQQLSQIKSRTQPTDDRSLIDFEDDSSHHKNRLI